MEALLFRIILAAFVLLTLTVVSGLFFSEQLFGKPLTCRTRRVFGILSWLIFAALLAGHHFRGWRGRTAVRLDPSRASSLCCSRTWEARSSSS
jgi:ABC-type uncharacterized transport system permease subunit